MIVFWEKIIDLGPNKSIFMDDENGKFPPWRPGVLVARHMSNADFSCGIKKRSRSHVQEMVENVQATTLHI